MIIDTRELPDSEKIEADVCIVGAGPAGISMARAYIGSGITVALVESGGLDFDPDTQELYKEDESDDWYAGFETMRLRFFGGTSNHWEGNCRPLDPIDFKGDRPLWIFWPAESVCSLPG